MWLLGTGGNIYDVSGDTNRLLTVCEHLLQAHMYEE